MPDGRHDADDEPDEQAEHDADDQRPDTRLHRDAEPVADLRIQLVRQVQREADPDDDRR